MVAIDLKPIAVRTGCKDTVGCLVMADDELVAILVKLDDAMHEADRGKWFLEAGFGKLRRTETFESLGEAEDWVRELVV